MEFTVHLVCDDVDRVFDIARHLPPDHEVNKRLHVEVLPLMTPIELVIDAI